MTALLIDASGLIYRAYHGTKGIEDGFRFRSDGVPTAAVRDFTESLMYLMAKGLWDPRAREWMRFDHIACVFDYPGRGWRHDIYPGYKPRGEKPDDLTEQMPFFRDAARALGLEPLELEEFEADDLLATYARLFRDEGDEVVLYTSDKDMMQLVRYGVRIFRPGMGREGFQGYREAKWIAENEVLAKFGVLPIKVPEVQALMGDAVDGVPGMPGCGPKKAAELIEQWGTAEMVIMMRHRTWPKFAKYLEENASLVRIARQLVTLDDDVPVTTSISGLRTPIVDMALLDAFLLRMEFPLLRRKAIELFAAVA